MFDWYWEEYLEFLESFSVNPDVMLTEDEPNMSRWSDKQWEDRAVFQAMIESTPIREQISG